MFRNKGKLSEKNIKAAYKLLKPDSADTIDEEAEWNNVLVGRKSIASQYENLEHLAEGAADSLEITLEDSEDKLTLWRFSNGSPLVKKEDVTAFVYVCGANESVSTAFARSDLQDLHIDDDKKLVFSQDYRGKGFNRGEGKHFYDYSMAQDVDDQKALIKAIGAHGYKNVIVIGSSYYGSQVAAWALAELINEDKKFNAITLIGNGSVTPTAENPDIAAWVGQGEAVNQRFIKDGMMSANPISNVLAKMPRAFIFNTNNKSFANFDIEAFPDIMSEDVLKAIKDRSPLIVDIEGRRKELLDEIKLYHEKREKEKSAPATAKYGKTIKLLSTEQLSSMLKERQYEAIIKLSEEKNPLTEGRLGDLVKDKIVPFCKGCLEVKSFNSWVYQQFELDKKEKEVKTPPTPPKDEKEVKRPERARFFKYKDEASSATVEALLPKDDKGKKKGK